MSNLSKQIRATSKYSAQTIKEGRESVEAALAKLHAMIDGTIFASEGSGHSDSLRMIQHMGDYPALLSNQLRVAATAINPVVTRHIMVNEGVDSVCPFPSADSRKWHMLAISVGQNIHLHDFCVGPHELLLGKHERRVICIAISALDSNRIASVSQDCKIKVWDLARRKELAVLSFNTFDEAPSHICNCKLQFVIGPNQQEILAFYDNFRLSLFDWRSNTRLYHTNSHYPTLSRNGFTIAIPTPMEIQLINVQTLTSAGTIVGQPLPHTLALSDDGRHVHFSTHDSRKVMIYEHDLESTSSWTLLGEWNESHMNDAQLFTNSEGKLQIVALLTDYYTRGTLKVWDIKTKTVQSVLQSGGGRFPPICSFALTEIKCGLRRHILIIAQDGRGIVQIWNPATEAVLIRFGAATHLYNCHDPGYKYWGSKLMMSSDGSNLLIFLKDVVGCCVLHGLAEALERQMLPSHNSGQNSTEHNGEVTADEPTVQDAGVMVREEQIGVAL